MPPLLVMIVCCAHVVVVLAAASLDSEALPPIATTSNPSSDATPSGPLSLTERIFFHAEQQRLDADLLLAVIQVESNFKPDSISRAGAMGLMQLMPLTARGLGVINPFDIEQNIAAGARYLRHLLDRFDGDLTLALAAYNAGPRHVRHYGGLPPFPETHGFVRRVLLIYGRSSAAHDMASTSAGSFPPNSSPGRATVTAAPVEAKKT